MKMGSGFTQMPPIQAVGQVYQAALANSVSVVSVAMYAAGPGGLILGLIPSLGATNCTTAAALSATLKAMATATEITAFLLVASGIKTQ